MTPSKPMPDPSDLVEWLRERAEYEDTEIDMINRDTIFAEAAQALISLQARLSAAEAEIARKDAALELAQRWLANSTPTTDLDGPLPLPVITAALQPTGKTST